MQTTEWPAHIRGRVQTLLVAAQRLAEVRAHRQDDDEALKCYERAHDAIYGVCLAPWERHTILEVAETTAQLATHTASCHVCLAAAVEGYIDYLHTGELTISIPLDVMRRYEV